MYPTWFPLLSEVKGVCQQTGDFVGERAYMLCCKVKYVRFKVCNKKGMRPPAQNKRGS